MSKNVRFRFTKVRDVKSPNRKNKGDAGLDFYIPTNLTLAQLQEANMQAKYVNAGSLEPNEYSIATDGKGRITKIFFGPMTRLSIPSGIRALLEPAASMMQANNKSGRSTKQGFIFTAEVCDSPYTGEYHIGVLNTHCTSQTMEVDKAAIQFVHVPIYLTEPEEISNKDYQKEAETWGTRGEKGMGSSNNE